MRETGHRVFLAGGGTGGHLYPGLALAEALRRRDPDVAVAFSCTRKAIDRAILERHGYPVTPLATRPFRPTAPWTWPLLAGSLIRAGNQARRRLREFCPDVVVGLGGYGSYAPVRVGQKYGAATAVLNPDIVAGRANRRLFPGASRVFCQFAETVDALGDAARLTGCPVRPSLLEATREEGLAAFGLDPDRRTLLVTGASLGARTVNRAVVRMLRDRGLPDGWQVLHLAGHADHPTVAAAYEDLDVRATVRAYADPMGPAYAAADLVVARAGASTVGELLAVGLPAVFVPYPFHRDRHQVRQARAVEAEGAAAVVEDVPSDPADTAGRLGEAVHALASDDARRASVAEAARAAGRPDAADAVAAEVLALAAEQVRRRHARLAEEKRAAEAAADAAQVDTGPNATYTQPGGTHP
ncbi:MAG: UDP-N-acetylglucosamine--N-acetylmuramyl-(pentapeptide) pyrophosphoryl-undecaprenol N-acetylglucosamine transferase [Phycisphaerae bacterium]